MATTSLFRKKGEVFLDQNGVPLAGGLLYYYRSGTSTQADTWSEQTGTTYNSFPLVLDSSGKLQEAVYIGTTWDLKEVLKDASGNTISPWPFDGIPKAVGATALTGFERLYQPWHILTSASSPVTLTGATVGHAYECDCTSGNIVINLPAIVGCQEGTGFTFKKTDATANTVTIVANGIETIDRSTTSITIGTQNMAFGVTNDTSQWLSTLYSALPYFLAAQRQSVTASTATLAIDMSKGWHVALSLAATVTAFTVTNWPATGTVGKLTLEITNTGAYNITVWPTTTTWSGGTAPTITSGASKRDTIVLTGASGSSTFRGYVVAQNMS